MIIVICAIGAYTVHNAMFDVWLMLVFGVVGYVFKKLDYPLAPLVLALVLGDKAEDSFRQSMLVSQGDVTIFWSNPLVGSITTLALLLLFWPLISKLLGARSRGRRRSIRSSPSSPSTEIAMTVIALTQEMGSLAKDVAEQRREDLGLQVMRHEVVDHVAEPDARADEPDQPAARGQGRHARAPARRPRRASPSTSTEEVLDLAVRGNVVLRGWGATCLLRAGAARRLRARDARRSSSASRWLHGAASAPTTWPSPPKRSGAATAPTPRAWTSSSASTWGDPLLYDLVLNTEPRLGRELRASRSLRSRSGPSSPRPTRRARCSQDLALEARVRAALRADEATTDVDVTVDERRRRASSCAASCSTPTSCRRPSASPRPCRAWSASTTN